MQVSSSITTFFSLKQASNELNFIIRTLPPLQGFCSAGCIHIRLAHFHPTTTGPRKCLDYHPFCCPHFCWRHLNCQHFATGRRGLNCYRDFGCFGSPSLCTSECLRNCFPCFSALLPSTDSTLRKIMV